MKQYNPRVLHSACLLSPTAGILKQMQLEQTAATALKLPWQTVMYRPCLDTSPPQADSIEIGDMHIKHHPNLSGWKKIRNWLSLRHHYYEWLHRQDCDIHLLRYYVHDPLQLAFIRQARKPVWLVHHSFEIPELALPGTSFAKLRAGLERFIGHRCIAAADGIIGVTPELADYQYRRGGRQEQTTLVYPNGYAVTADPLTDNRSQKHIELLFVASHFDAWHGLDLLLDTLAANTAFFTLHLVGTLNSQQQARAATDGRIRLHGLLDKPAIDTLTQQCWLGLSSFALFRKNMTQACTLKVREYLSQGLPVYSGHADIFPPDFAYYRHGPADIDAILDYARVMRKVSREQVRQNATPFIDKSRLLQQLYQALNAHHHP